MSTRAGREGAMKRRHDSVDDRTSVETTDETTDETEEVQRESGSTERSAEELDEGTRGKRTWTVHVRLGGGSTS